MLCNGVLPFLDKDSPILIREEGALTVKASTLIFGDVSKVPFNDNVFALESYVKVSVELLGVVMVMVVPEIAMAVADLISCDNRLKMRLDDC